jgi:hypothetical protein
MIPIASLTDADRGQWVVYGGRFGLIERGRIKSWNNRFIHVVYYCDGHWDQWEEYTAASTLPDYLVFAPNQ